VTSPRCEAPRVLEPPALFQGPCMHHSLHHPIQFQVLSQLTPQTVIEIDGLLGNKPHPKK